MKLALAVATGRMIVALACAAVAGYLALEGKTGWGWLLFASLWLGAITASEKSGDKLEDA